MSASLSTVGFTYQLGKEIAFALTYVYHTHTHVRLAHSFDLNVLFSTFIHIIYRMYKFVVKMMERLWKWETKDCFQLKWVMVMVVCLISCHFLCVDFRWFDFLRLTIPPLISQDKSRYDELLMLKFLHIQQIFNTIQRVYEVCGCQEIFLLVSTWYYFIIQILLDNMYT